jgi:hypothetical protein
MKQFLLRGVMLIGGTAISMVNLLPLPWSLRLVWLRFLFFLTVKGTLLFPSTLRFVVAQNEAYRMGKQHGESLESFVQLEKILEHTSLQKIPLDRVRGALKQAEDGRIPPEQFGAFIARAIFDQPTADRLLEASLQDMRY